MSFYFSSSNSNTFKDLSVEVVTTNLPSRENVIELTASIKIIIFNND